ncbi:MAG: BrnT family toxin [Geminicoccaceae bacterium]
MLDLSQIVGFDWDDGNARKSVERHGVVQAEAEAMFFQEPLLIVDDPRHSLIERRYHALGMTPAGRLLQATFTLRGDGSLVRIISVRDMSRKERKVYAEAT